MELLPNSMSFRVINTIDITDDNEIPVDFTGRVRRSFDSAQRYVAWYTGGHLDDPTKGYPAYRVHRGDGQVKYEMHYRNGVLDDPDPQRPPSAGTTPAAACTTKSATAPAVVTTGPAAWLPCASGAPTARCATNCTTDTEAGSGEHAGAPARLAAVVVAVMVVATAARPGLGRRRPTASAASTRPAIAGWVWPERPSAFQPLELVSLAGHTRRRRPRSCPIKTSSSRAVGRCGIAPTRPPWPCR